MGLAKWKERLSNAVSKNSNKIDQGIDRATNYANEKTGRKHSDKIDNAAKKAREYKDKLKDDNQS